MPETEKWAVENTNLDLKESVRVFETPQEAVAKLICGNANAAFTDSGRNCSSKFFRIE